jgi:hypothetical protein
MDSRPTARLIAPVMGAKGKASGALVGGVTLVTSEVPSSGSGAARNAMNGMKKTFVRNMMPVYLRKKPVS